MNPAVRLARYVYFCAADPMKFGGGYNERERFTSSVFISPRRDFLFVKNEKAGNNTARMTLQHLAAERPLPERFRDANRWMAPMLMPSDLDLREIEDLNSSIPFKFAIVRNPYSRTLSAYLNKIQADGPKATKFRKKVGKGGPLEFGEFVDSIAGQDAAQMDPHWRPQTVNLFCDRIQYDQWVKFENYDQEFRAILMRFFGRAPLHNVHKNNTRAGTKLADFYTPRIAEIVGRLYARDFDTFGYACDVERAKDVQTKLA